MNFRKFTVLFAIVLIFVVWIILFWFIKNYGDAVRGNPIAFGAKRFGLECTCTDKDIPGAYMYINSSGNVTYYYPETYVGRLSPDINFSQLEK